MLGLLGILEAGRGIAAPPAIGGEWIVEFDSETSCESAIVGLRQPAFIISQSGGQALVTLNDGRASTISAAVNGTTLNARSLHATISGKRGEHAIEGQISFDGCVPAEFRAFRQASGKRGE